MQFISADKPDHAVTMQNAYVALEEAMSFAIQFNLMFADGLIQQNNYDGSVQGFEVAVAAMRDALHTVQLSARGQMRRTTRG